MKPSDFYEQYITIQHEGVRLKTPKLSKDEKDFIDKCVFDNKSSGAYLRAGRRGGGILVDISALREEYLKTRKNKGGIPLSLQHPKHG